MLFKMRILTFNLYLIDLSSDLVPGAGIEPAWEFKSRGILSPLRLPISPPGHR